VAERGSSFGLGGLGALARASPFASSTWFLRTGREGELRADRSGNDGRPSGTTELLTTGADGRRGGKAGGAASAAGWARLGGSDGGGPSLHFLAGAAALAVGPQSPGALHTGWDACSVVAALVGVRLGSGGGGGLVLDVLNIGWRAFGAGLLAVS
jgi:hypothetical protein